MKLHSIQTLRFVAAALVIVCHYASAPMGAVGVDIFFVISGFIITRVMQKRTPAQFLCDRLRRIYPIYWICAVPTAILAAYAGLDSLARTLTSITLWPVFAGEYLQPYLVLGWTLSFEMLFYLCATLVIVDRRLLWLLAVVYALAMLGAFITEMAVLRFIGNPLISEFLMGATIACFAQAGARPAAGAVAISVAIVLLALSDAAGLYLPRSAFEFTAPQRAIEWGVPAAMIVWGTLQFERPAQSWRLFPYLGDASYSIYLVHGMAGYLFFFLPWPLKIPAAVAFGVAVYRCLECPLLRTLDGNRQLKPA